ncbi:hypothetical protein L3Q82_003412 [Scortum barcoo]|uniref:Uncharacterized protein n=1 Tax=Scortum barcoo TaxID=214431 RepID=A0ACB8VMW1_9TELE|nr:hypothetical protein L3Q82_003412 [Scortum barcoo]
MPSTDEEAEAGDSEVDSSITQDKVTEAPAAPSALPAKPVDDPPQDIYSAPPEPFGSEPHLCRGFLSYCSLRPVFFTTDVAKIHYILGLLHGRALTGAARFARGALEGVTYREFLEDLKLVFDRPNAHFCASSSLMKLSQGRRSVEEYTLEFRTLAVEVDSARSPGGRKSIT